jgi:ATP citrate (pro-S)-lyase
VCTTKIVPLALGIGKDVKSSGPNGHLAINGSNDASASTAFSGAQTPVGASPLPTPSLERGTNSVLSFDNVDASSSNRPWYRPFDSETRSFVYGLQPRAIQGMLDFDYACGRAVPSVAAMIYPFGGHHVQKVRMFFASCFLLLQSLSEYCMQFYWGVKEVLLPVYQGLDEAVKKHPEADVLVNFASSRSVFQSTLEALEFPQIRAIGIIAEGVPERHARQILHAAEKKKVIIIGPATVGGIKPGCFKIGNTGGYVFRSPSKKLSHSKH